MGDADEMDAESVVQAYVNIMVGSSTSIGKLPFCGVNKVIQVPFCIFFFITSSIFCHNICPQFGIMNSNITYC